MIDYALPRETEIGSAGEQPIEGYRGQAHQTMERNGWGVEGNRRHAPTSIHRMIDLLMPQKRIFKLPQTRVQGMSLPPSFDSYRGELRCRSTVARGAFWRRSCLDPNRRRLLSQKPADDSPWAGD